MIQQLIALWNTVMTYGVYRETVHEGPLNPSAFMNQLLFGLFVELPYGFFQFFVALITILTQVLDLTAALQPFQAHLMNTARATFLGLIGGANGKIGSNSVIGVLLGLTVLYLIYQWLNGKGHFLRAFGHLVAVVSVMFFFFGNFSYTDQSGQAQYKMGGLIVFDTVNQVTKDAKGAITKALTGVSTSDSSGAFLVDYVLKPTTNFINVGNPKGELKDGQFFDYQKAKLEREAGKNDYVDEVAQNNPSLKNTGTHLPFQMISGLLGAFNLIIYALPILLINLLISSMGLLACFLIVLLPIMALASFIPTFRNAFFNGIKVLLGLSVAPVLLSVLVGVLFYLMTLVDTAVLAVLTGQSVTNFALVVLGLQPVVYLVAMPVIFILKVFFMYWLWQSRKSISKQLTGNNTATPAFDFSGVEQTMKQAGQKVKGAALIGAGLALENPQLALQGANMVAPDLTHAYQTFKGTGASSGGDLEETLTASTSAEATEPEEQHVPDSKEQDNALSFDEPLSSAEEPDLDLFDRQETSEDNSEFTPFEGLDFEEAPLEEEQGQVLPFEEISDGEVPSDSEGIAPFEVESTADDVATPTSSETPETLSPLEEDEGVAENPSTLDSFHADLEDLRGQP